jgi:hypothetical protein
MFVSVTEVLNLLLFNSREVSCLKGKLIWKYYEEQKVLQLIFSKTVERREEEVGSRIHGIFNRKVPPKLGQ